MAELTILSKFYLFLVGLLVGAVSPTFGIGGGLLTVPILILFFGFDGNLATATSLGLIIFTTLSGTIAYYMEKRIDFVLAGIFMIFAVPGTLLGGYAANYLAANETEIDALQFIFATFMLVIAGSKLVSLYAESRKKPIDLVVEAVPPQDTEFTKIARGSVWMTNRIYREFMDQRKIRFKYEVKVFPKVLIGFAGGLLGSLLGLGGGIIYVPVLTMFMGVPIGIAAATSTFTILVSSILPIFVRYPFIQWEYVLYLAAGTVISASIIPKFISKVQSETILKGFWLIVALTSFRLLVNVISLLF